LGAVYFRHPNKRPMAQRYSASLLLLATALGAFAQPTLPSGSNSFAPGESYTYGVGDYFTPPSVGEANTTWDYSTYTSSSTFTAVFSPPSTGGGMAGATVAEAAGGGAYAYHKATASAFEQLGVIGTGFNVNCTLNPITAFAYPFTFASEVNDTYDCTGVSGGQAFNRDSGTVVISGSSYGTLILPSGTYTNVLLVNYEQHHYDWFTNDPDFTIDYNAFIQFWIKPGIKAPLLANYEAYQVPGSLHLYSRVLDAEGIGMEEARRHDIGMDLMPNPATDRVEVLFGVGAGKRLTIELIDLTGKTVMSTRRTTQVNTVQREILDLTGLASGAYTVRVTDETGAMGAKRLVVN